ncbi:complement C1q-like protein 3 [Salmo salar]|uniref:Complement C1q-like protein 3 n=1 Tax=Salmo salar TaxID=8030 RepID=A0A1S3NIA5_SALSA|nr:complement C1q-like protein 3 [Salmo salar]|eukprot:XP_014015132.1 PREDICTED: complement C1q-like protein 3 [Salmo salar]
MKKLRMKVVVLLMLSLCLTLSGAQGEGTSLSNSQLETCSFISELAVLKVKLDTMDQKLGAVETRLQVSESQVDKLNSVNKAQEKQLKKLKKDIAAGQLKVAFSAALRTSGSGYIGPFTTHTPLQYKRVFSNFGSGYNPATGIFTAMVKGVYYFRYTMFYNGNANAVVALMKNEEFLVSTWDAVSGRTEDSASNAVIVQLEVGDNVFAQLSANRNVYEDGGNYNTFSGFLLFTN